MRSSYLTSLAVLAVLLFPACADGAAGEDDLAARAAAAGLSPAQADSLAAFGHPVVVPAGTEGFELVGFSFGEHDFGTFTAPYYELSYRRDDGACVDVRGDSEGLGGLPWPEADHPPVPIPALGIEVWILEDTFGPAAEDGGPGARGIEWMDLGDPDREEVEVGDMHASVLTGSFFSDDECRPLPVDEFAAFVASLRFLDPSYDRDTQD